MGLQMKRHSTPATLMWMDQHYHLAEVNHIVYTKTHFCIFEFSFFAGCLRLKKIFFCIFLISLSWMAQYTLQRQNTEILKQFPEKEYRGLSPNFHNHASVSGLYISTIGLPFLL